MICQAEKWNEEHEGSCGPCRKEAVCNDGEVWLCQEHADLYEEEGGISIWRGYYIN